MRTGYYSRSSYNEPSTTNPERILNTPFDSDDPHTDA